MATAVDLWFSPISRLAELYRRRTLSPVELTCLLLERIARLNPRLHAFITVAGDQAMADARAAESRLREGDPRPLLGIPIAVKDSIATRGIRTTGNSRVLEDWIPAQDAAVVRRLRDAGMVVLGKTNLNEFGWSIPHEDDLCPPPRNPWNPQYLAIGSSSGSGVAVAAGLVIAALGTDSGGSVRLPAGQLGLVGIKPTHASISRAGVLHGGSIGEVGVLTRTVEDGGLLLDAVAGSDSHPPVDFTSRLDGGLQGLRVGVPWHYIDEVPVEPEVRAAFEAALAEVARLGATVSHVALPALKYARAANMVVLNAEHYAAHERTLPQHWHRYGRSARLYLAQGAFVSAAEYLRAREVGRLARQAVDAVLGDVDLLALPVSPIVTTEAARQPDAHRRGTNASFTAPFNLTGHPAVAVPCGIGAVGLPIGFQLTARYGNEPVALMAAHAYAQATGWAARHPQEL